MITLKDPGLPLKFRIALDQAQHRIAGMLVEHQHIAGVEIEQVLHIDTRGSQLHGHSHVAFL